MVQPMVHATRRREWFSASRWAIASWDAPAPSIRTRILVCLFSSGTWTRTWSITVTWSAAVLLPEFPGRDLLARAAPAFLADGDARTLRAIPVTLRQIWTRLYQAGSGSSFYGPRQGGAHGRLHAWQAIAALTAAPTAAIPDDVATLARACRWFALDITSAWYWGVWWLSDVTLACVGPEPERVHVRTVTFP